MKRREILKSGLLAGLLGVGGETVGKAAVPKVKGAPLSDDIRVDFSNIVYSLLPIGKRLDVGVSYTFSIDRPVPAGTLRVFMDHLLDDYAKKGKGGSYYDLNLAKCDKMRMGIFVKHLRDADKECFKSMKRGKRK